MYAFPDSQTLQLTYPSISTQYHQAQFLCYLDRTSAGLDDLYIGRMQVNVYGEQLIWLYAEQFIIVQEFRPFYSV